MLDFGAAGWSSEGLSHSLVDGRSRSMAVYSTFCTTGYAFRSCTWFVLLGFGRYLSSLQPNVFGSYICCDILKPADDWELKFWRSRGCKSTTNYFVLLSYTSFALDLGGYTPAYSLVGTLYAPYFALHCATSFTCFVPACNS